MTKNKSIMLTGDFNKSYLHPLVRNKLDTFLTPYNINVLNSGDATKTTNNSDSLIDCYFGDSIVERIFSFNGDSSLKTDHKAVFLVLNNKLFYKTKTPMKTIYDKSSYAAKQFQQLLEEINWIPFYSRDVAEGMLKEFVLNVST